MPIAVGMIETIGFPAVVEASDAMVKAARGGGQLFVEWRDRRDRGCVVWHHLSLCGAARPKLAPQIGSGSSLWTGARVGTN